MTTPQQARPFAFKGLPKANREEIDFFNAMAKITPIEVFPLELPHQLFERLTPYIHASFQWQWTGQSHALTFQQLSRYCLNPTLLIQVAMLPLQQHLLIEFDPRLASIMIDRTLGGEGANIDLMRPLSEIEQGVLNYLLLKVIHEVQVVWGNQVQLEFRLARVEHSLDALRNDFSPETSFYRREMHCSLNGQNGFVRVHIPTTLIQEIAKMIPDTRNTPQEYAFYQTRIHRIADTPLCGLLRVGMVDLSEADFQGLQSDDIVLIRECLVRRREEDGLWEGEGILQFSERPNFAFRCTLQNEPSSPVNRICIEEVIQLGEPPMIGDFDRSEYHHEDLLVTAGEYQKSMSSQGENYEEMGPVLSDVPVPLIVELGRVECRARDIMYMRVGQILELHRSPHEPLHLVVNNQVMGRGELVEVDGQLGIRIIELVK